MTSHVVADAIQGGGGATNDSALGSALIAASFIELGADLGQ
jgi:hypothetical protein